MKRNAWLILIGVVLALAGLWAAAEWFSANAVVDMAPARSGPIRTFIDEQAKTRLPKTWLITMPYSGRIEAVTLAEGDKVEQGQLVAQIVPVDLEHTLQEAQAVVDRLDAAIAENAYSEVEKTALRQAQEFVKSMNDTVEMARERVKAGLARADYAEKNLGRVRELVASRTVPQDELDRAYVEHVQASVDLAQDRLVLSATESLAAATNLLPTMIGQYIQGKSYTEAVLQKQRTEAAARLSKTREDHRRGLMTSPIDGVVLARHVSNERFLTAGELLVELGRLGDLEIEAEVLTLEVVDVEEGDPVEIYGPAIGPKPARGYVHAVYPAGFTKLSSLGVEQQRVMVIVRFAEGELERLLQRGLGVGFRVRVKVFTAEKAEALVVPRPALFRGEDGTWQVFAVRDGRARRQRVEVGLMNDQQAEILKGLQPGELVVLAPESSLEDGMRVASE